MTLEHFKYPEIFIRRTKKAYISIVTDSILELAKQSATCGYNALRLAVKRRALDMNMAYCRKTFATNLRMNGIEQDIIDLLQGRFPKSVFVRHYFRPDFNHDRIKEAIDSLYDTLVQGQIGACRESWTSKISLLVYSRPQQKEFRAFGIEEVPQRHERSNWTNECNEGIPGRNSKGT